jgi:hypothetical protein
MGNDSSKSNSKNNEVNKKQQTKNKSQELLYAEIISNKIDNNKNNYDVNSDNNNSIINYNDNNNQNQKNIPPMKILLNNYITSSTVDSIRDSMKDSKEYLNMLSRELLLGILHDNKNQHIFGDFLKYSFSYESILLPTRELIYYSLNDNNTYHMISSYLNNEMLRIINNENNYIKKSIVNSSIYHIHDNFFKSYTFYPLIIWTIEQQEIVIDPLTKIIRSALPYTKV